MSVAEGVADCAARSTFFIRYLGNENRTFNICSAFAYALAPSDASPSVIVTARHCLPPPSNATCCGPLMLMRLEDPSAYACSVVASFEESDDVAIIACPGLGLAGLALAPSDERSAARSHLRVAAAGFIDDDAYAGSTTRFHLGGDLPNTALYIRHADTSNIAGPGLRTKAGSVHSSGTGEYSRLQSPAGFVDMPIYQGMSGGPVLDMRCHVVGVGHGRTDHTGVIASLAKVNAHIAGMIATAAEAEAAAAAATAAAAGADANANANANAAAAPGAPQEGSTGAAGGAADAAVAADGSVGAGGAAAVN